jgi:hypothetical protein
LTLSRPGLDLGFVRSLGMSARSAVPEPDLAAAYSLALRVAGDEAAAAESVQAALRARPATRGAFVRAVRDEARARRAHDAPPSSSPRRPEGVAAAEWDVLERVALRGARLAEAADELGLDRREALSRLHRGLLAAGRALGDEREPRDDPRPALGPGLGRDLAAGRLDDPARDRQPETAAAA